MVLNVTPLFDPDRSRRPPLRALVREVVALATYRAAPPDPAGLPHGGGRAVLVVPAFLTGDGLTRGLRRFLERCGFVPHGWGLGVNWGPTPRLLTGLERRLDHLAARHGPVCLVGISLGGLLARDLAHRRLDAVAHVLTVASPIRLPTASRLEPLIRLLARGYSPDVDPARLAAPLPMPSTMLYTADDGIVAPDSCCLDEAEGMVVALRGPHLVLTGTPAAMEIIVRRLAPPTRDVITA